VSQQPANAGEVCRSGAIPEERDGVYVEATWRDVTLSSCGTVLSNCRRFEVTASRTKDEGQRTSESLYPYDLV
jgi:hypothetical protein